MDPGSEPAPRNLRRGFRRLSFVVWLFGAGFSLLLAAEPVLRPLTQVCVPEEDPVYEECLTQEAREAAGAHIGRRLLARIDGTWEAVDTTKQVRRMDTARYREELRTFASYQAIWALSIFGLFYLLLWVASGFRGSE